MDHIPNRFDRIVAILIQLQSRKVVKAKDLADRFGVTLRTIYRDIKSLEAAGVPVIGEAGTGYFIMDGYRLPPVMFSREEAGSFVAAEKLMEKFTDELVSAHFASAMFKIKSVLRSDEKNMVEFLEGQIDIAASPIGFNKNIPHALQHVIQSMTEKKQILVDYRSADDPQQTRRKLEVTGIFHENQVWYIYAWCHLRKDYRQFRIDRIINLQITQEPFSRNHPTLQELRSKKKKKLETTRVRIRVKRSVAPHIHFGRQYHGFVSENICGDWIEMEFDAADVEMSFARWFVMFADHAHILEPESLKISVRRILDEAVKKLA
jgi:predicted DNA-binding transcriptional regulator YafY